MLTVETIRKIRLARHREKKSIRQIADDLNLSRNTVKKVLRSESTEFGYRRKNQPRPKLGSFIDSLDKKLKEDEPHPVKLRRTARVLFEEIQAQGYSGSYDSVQRFVKSWHEERHILSRQAFIPLIFAPGEAFQFDWSHEQVELDGMPATVKVAHIRLCHSRLFICIAYPRESQEMVFDAHERAFGLFGGVCKRGIYDNMKTAVTAILRGKQRDFNKRFEQMCSHYLFDPVACTPGAGWEKGQVENQVGVIRRRFFIPRPKHKNLAELNDWLMSQCIAWAKTRPHPEIKESTIWQVFEDEKPFLVSVSAPFDGYCSHAARVSSTSLVSFDRNRYSVLCAEAGRIVEVRAYAAKIAIISRGRLVAEHEREYGRDKTVFNPWHYLPILERKPGALRNGAPFKEWNLPEGLRETRTFLERFPDGDRQFVGILSAVSSHGLDAVERACKEALKTCTGSKDIVLNLLSRQGEEKTPLLLVPKFRLKEDPVTDCSRYDRLLREADNAAK